MLICDFKVFANDIVSGITILIFLYCEISLLNRSGTLLNNMAENGLSYAIRLL